MEVSEPSEQSGGPSVDQLNPGLRVPTHHGGHALAPDVVLLARAAVSAPAAMIVIEAETAIIRAANRSARTLLAAVSSQHLGEITGKSLFALVPVLRDPAFQSALADVAATGVPSTGNVLEERVMRDGDTPLSIGFDISPIVEGGQLTDDVLLILTDCTEAQRERQRVESRIFSAQLQTERLERILEVISEAVVVYDRDGQVMAYNRAALSFARNRSTVERARAHGIRVTPEWPMLQPDGSPLQEVEYPSWRVLLTFKPLVGIQCQISVESGATVPVLVHAAPLSNEEDTVTGAVVAFQDISAVKEVERLKDEFIQTASHELKQPVTVIRGQAQLALRSLEKLEASGVLASDENPLRAPLSTVAAQTDRLKKLVNELLDTSRIQGGKLELVLERVDLVALIERQVDTLRKANVSHQFALELELPDGNDSVVGRWDAGRIEQIVTNLLTNAVKYSPNGDMVRIHVAIRKAGTLVRIPGTERRRKSTVPHVEVSVQDYGIGIPPQVQSRVFERFFRALNTPGIEGTGLGMYISRQLAWAHKGDLWFESPGLGQGTTFHLLLPLG